MPLFTSDQLARYEQRAEEKFCQDFKCMIDRIALTIVSGTSTYTLPDEVMDIRRITYRGIKLDPMSHRDFKANYDGLSSSGRPFSYIYNVIGALQIRLFPSPVETLAVKNANLFDQEVIRASCIVEYYAMPDGLRFRLPSYMRKRLLRAYVLSQAYAAEGKGQNIKAAKYWKSKWDYLKETYSDVLHDLYERPRKLITTGVERYPKVPAPVLPISIIGIGVDSGT